MVGEYVQRAEQDTPFRANLVQEKAKATSHVRIYGNACWGFQPFCSDQKQIRIQGMDAKLVGTGRPESITENILLRERLLDRSVIGHPGYLLQLLHEHGGC